MLLREEKIQQLHLVMTAAACRVARSELGLCPADVHSFVGTLGLSEAEKSKVFLWEDEDLDAGIASGSYLLDGVIVLPCSSGMAGSLAHGISRGLGQRLGDVALKEGRTLILGIRETPMSEILLENLLRLARAGATILPPIPAFYLQKEADDAMEVFLAAYCLRVLDLLGWDLSSGDLRWVGR